MSTVKILSRRAWETIRALLGDDAYERYVAHVARHHPGATPIGRAAFHRADVERRWSQINRCC